MRPKLVWRVQPSPTGPYRSFERRGWPGAAFDDGSPAFMLMCGDDYEPSRVKDGKHGPISIRVADRRPETIASHGAWQWRKLSHTASTLKEAKELCEKFLEDHPDFYPQAPEEQ